MAFTRQDFPEVPFRGGGDLGLSDRRPWVRRGGRTDPLGHFRRHAGQCRQCRTRGGIGLRSLPPYGRGSGPGGGGGNFDVYRFSTSWARVLPEGGRGAVNQAGGLDFYDRLVDGLLERGGVKPALTLYHWELPSPLADEGGWRNRAIADWFADYVDVVATRLGGDRIWSAAPPINEPWCVAWLSHFEGHHAPPGLRDIRAAARAMHHVLLCHGRAIEVMRGHGMSNLGGAVCNFEYAQPVDDSPPAAQQAAGTFDASTTASSWAGCFAVPIRKRLCTGWPPRICQGMGAGFDLIGQPLDWLGGLNYYTRKVLGPSHGPPWPGYAYLDGPPLPKTDMGGWEIYPEGGLGHFLRLAHDHAPDLPLVVTENGMATPGGLRDVDRIAYVDAHLNVVRAAIADGLPVAGGYYLWSLLDNYEWALGYDKRFGLVHVDFETLDRTPKLSYERLKLALTRS